MQQVLFPRSWTGCTGKPDVFVHLHLPYPPPGGQKTAVKAAFCAGTAEGLQKKRSKIKEKTFFFGKYKNILKKLLTNPALRDKIHHVPNGTYALVAQLDRVTDYESVGRGFESLPSHQVKSHD